MRTYYFVIDGKQYGPVKLDEVSALGITPTTLTWYEGMDNWAQAAAIPEIADIIYAKQKTETEKPATTVPDEMPPVPEQNNQIQGTPSHPKEQPAIHPAESDDECPQPHLGLAIFSAIMFPTGIAAIVKTSLIKPRWQQGRYDDARWLAKTARKVSITSIILGAIMLALVITYYIALISALVSSSRHGYYY